MRPVYFLSDFGLEDPYVAVVKAVLRSGPRGRPWWTWPTPSRPRT